MVQKLLTAAFLLIFVPILAFATPPEPEKTSVTIQIPKETLNKLTQDQRLFLKDMLSPIEERMYDWINVTFNPPASVFSEHDGQIIKLSSLFKAPSNDEVHLLGGDKLSQAQLESIKQEALFVVPSQDYRGQDHVWKVNTLFQKGRKNIEIKFLEAKADALAQLVVEVPARVFGDDAISVKRGIDNIYYGLVEMTGLLVGVPETTPVYSPNEVEEIVQNERRIEVRLGLANALSKDGPIDNLNLVNDEILERYYHRVLQIEEETDKFWQQEKEKVTLTLAEKISKMPISTADADQLLVDQVVLEEQNRFYDAILNDSQIDPEIGKLFVNHGRAIQLVMIEEQRFSESLKELADTIRVGLQKNHPVESRIPEWLESKVTMAVNANMQGRLKSFYQSLSGKLRGAGLAGEADQLELELAFALHEASGLRAELQSQREPGKTFQIKHNIWRMSRWRVVKDENAYRLETSDIRQVNTSQSGWRVVVAAENAVKYFKNGLRTLWMDNLIDGPLGLKSQFSEKPFNYRMDFNPADGSLKIDEIAKRGTYVSRLKGFYQKRREILDEHEKSTDYGILGKSGERFFLFFKADLGLGFAMPMLVGLGQPALTAANAAFTLAATATSVVWAPVSSMMVMGSNALLYDSYGTGVDASGKPVSRFAPLINRVLIKGAILGIGESIGSLLAAAVYHPLVSTVMFFSGKFRAMVRSLWDSMWFQFIKRNGKVPHGNRWAWKRVKGPGLSAEYYYQVNTDVALVALWASFEQANLYRYIEQMKNIIDRPRENFRAYAEDILNAAFGPLGVSSSAPALGSIGKNQLKNHEALRKAVLPSEQMYSQLFNSGGAVYRGKTKLKQKDLELALQKGAVLAKKFHLEQFKALNMDESEIKNFWEQQKLSKNDWTGLARKHYRDVFGAEFLSALETTDKTLTLDVSVPAAAEFVQALEVGTTPEDFAVVTLVNSEMESKSAIPRVQKLGASMLCRKALISDERWNQLEPYLKK